MLFSKALILIHVLGLAIALGSASVKLVLLVKCRSFEYIPFYLKVVRPITRLLITGLILVTLSGIIWLVRGFPFTPVLVTKVILVVLVWIIGPVIDNVIEPKFVTAAASGATLQVAGAYRKYLTAEVIATSLLYAITLFGVIL